MELAARLRVLACPRKSIAALLFTAFALFTGIAQAATYWTVPAVMKSFFPTSKKVTFKRVTLTPQDAADIAKRVGVESIKRDWVVYFGETDGRRDGYAIVDEEKGMHDPIDFAVRFTEGGVVDRVEVMVYREAYGEEIRSPRFRAQFGGKTAADSIVAGKDIDVVSGASISCRSMAIGVKRDLLVIQTALKGRAL
jgi:Na+-translocating ferredoxin:NAD+ oxidoreductase RnfG subunit